ncbi:unnamed protein product [Caretta caretta]
MKAMLTSTLSTDLRDNQDFLRLNSQDLFNNNAPGKTGGGTNIPAYKKQETCLLLLLRPCLLYHVLSYSTAIHIASDPIDYLLLHLQSFESAMADVQFSGDNAISDISLVVASFARPSRSS